MLNKIKLLRKAFPLKTSALWIADKVENRSGYEQNSLEFALSWEAHWASAKLKFSLEQVTKHRI